MAVREMNGVEDWDAEPELELARRATDCVEDGEVLWLSRLRFDLTAGEERFLTPSVSDMLEQTYFLPVEAMAYPERSPLRILERSYGRALT